MVFLLPLVVVAGSVFHTPRPPLSPSLSPRQSRSDAIAKPVHKNIFQNSRRPLRTSLRSSPSSESRMVSLHKQTTKTVGCCVADLAMVKGGLREVGGSIPEGVTPLVHTVTDPSMAHCAAEAIDQRSALAEYL